MAEGLTAEELRPLEHDELVQKLKEARRSCSTSASSRRPGSSRTTARLRQVRREIARIYTVMRERELGIINDREGRKSE